MYLGTVKLGLNNGLPQIEQDILRELGWTPEQIASAAKVSGGFMDFLPLQWQQLLTTGIDGIISLKGEIGDYIDERIQTFPSDLDNDGVPNDEDACLVSDLRSTVVVAGCNSGVINHLLDKGCTIADRITECAAGAGNHGAFVSCVAHLTDDLKRAGIIGGKEKGALQSCAAQANLP